MVREYTISIQAVKNAAQIADNVVKDFGCEISEPSIFLSPDTSIKKGLTFLDKNGNPLESSIFKNQAYFDIESVSEENAIEMLIYTMLYEHYHFGHDDVKILVLPFH